MLVVLMFAVRTVAVAASFGLLVTYLGFGEVDPHTLNLRGMALLVGLIWGLDYFLAIYATFTK